MKKTLHKTFVIALAIVVGLGINYAVAWNGPSSTPPNDNPGIINTSILDQIKGQQYDNNGQPISYGSLLHIDNMISSDSLSAWLNAQILGNLKVSTLQDSVDPVNATNTTLRPVCAQADGTLFAGSGCTGLNSGNFDFTVTPTSACQVSPMPSVTVVQGSEPDPLPQGTLFTDTMSDFFGIRGFQFLSAGSFGVSVPNTGRGGGFTPATVTSSTTTNFGGWDSGLILYQINPTAEPAGGVIYHWGISGDAGFASDCNPTTGSNTSCLIWVKGNGFNTSTVAVQAKKPDGTSLGRPKNADDVGRSLPRMDACMGSTYSWHY